MPDLSPDALETRLRRLEAAVFADGREAPGPPASDPEAPVSDDEVFWALRGLQQRTASVENGAVLLTGAVTVAAGPVQWQYARATDELLSIADDPDGEDDTRLTTTAARLAAIGSPVRLRLLLAVVNGTTALHDLAGLDGIGTTGQVYHHVRTLTAAGWLQAAGRGRVAVPPARIVPLLVAVAAMD